MVEKRENCVKWGCGGSRRRVGVKRGLLREVLHEVGRKKRLTGGLDLWLWG